MSDVVANPDVASVTDRRPVPRGVLPRGMQTWLMVAIALGMLAVILFTGRAEPPARSTAVPTSAPPQPNTDRVRDYQDRLRIMESRAAQEARADAVAQQQAPALTHDDPPPMRSEDPLVSERKRRDYESLFASNVVLSRRPEGQRPDSGQARTPIAAPARGLTDPAAPSIDDIADAAVRASIRATGAAPAAPGPAAASAATGQMVPRSPQDRTASQRPPHSGPIDDAGPLHRILEGTIIDAVLTNRLVGGAAAPVNCLVTNAVYSHSGQQVVIPAGARLLGETKPVQTFGETRLAVAFHRLLLPDGSTYTLDQYPGANQVGDAGLKDQVDNHYWSTFGAAAAIGLISGLAQAIGTAGLAAGEGNRTVIVAGGAADVASQAAAQAMNRFLNRLPTITIREGHRVKVYLTSDLELPAYSAASGRF
ncbi:MAG: TrbI/VirB10 family protein [Acidobacteria bacterium]|nr:TrbI/VirB10 family protein [Acidobacteriota bacterium]